MDISTLVFCALVAMLSGATQALTGFGFVMVSMPFFILVFDPKTAVGLSLMLSFFSITALMYSVRVDTNWQLVKRISGGAYIGLPLGLLVFSRINAVNLKVYASLVILLMSLLSLKNYSFKFEPEQAEKYVVPTGIISGILSGSVGMSGPPIALFLSSLDVEKEEFRATTLAFFLLLHPSSFIPMFALGSLPLHTAKIALYLIPFVFTGMFIGRKLFNHISNTLFKKIVLVFLIIVAAYSLVTSLL
ncbi:MAG: sulfite exporter TauE/SafE family protein [Bacillota bacterium]